jgi:hypothetical protein
MRAYIDTDVALHLYEMVSAFIEPVFKLLGPRAPPPPQLDIVARQLNPVSTLSCKINFDNIQVVFSVDVFLLKCCIYFSFPSCLLQNPPILYKLHGI